MSSPLWVIETADRFWREAGADGTFPRDLPRAIASCLPVAVVLLPALRLDSVDAWLRRQAVLCAVPAGDRPLRACLVARRGHGIVFVDGADPEDEQRFSLAHELAHFLRDYWLPRERATARLGPEILQVFDGDRPARPAERVDALVARVPIGFHVHLMERGADGAVVDRGVGAAEHGADRLAYELLAPSARVQEQIGSLPASERRAAAARLLADAYGLPAPAAGSYAALLVPPTASGDSLTRRLGLRP